jgi:GT2 family glycosyltransferase
LSDVAQSEGELTAEGSALSVVVVAYESADAFRRTLPAIVAELRPGDELIVCDNGSADETVAVVRELAPEAILLEAGANLGFAEGCNRAAAMATNGLLLLLNPDNVVAAGFRDAIELPIVESRGWSAWQALVVDEGGERINTFGNDVHFTGISWAGGAGLARSAAPTSPQEVTVASGACLAIRRAAWEELGGFSEPYFLYQEDTDLSLRLWLAGHTVGIEPRAICEHDYEFVKGGHKWRYLERNRWATIIRTYPTRLLIPLIPALIATDLALLLVATVGGWLPQKLRANVEVLARLPRLLRERRAIQTAAVIDAARFADLLRPELDSDFLGSMGRSGSLRWALCAYWRAVRSRL